MISKLVLLLILSGSIGAGPAGLKGQETAAPVGTHVISGTVLDDRSGDPVSGAGVRVVVDGRTVGRARTGEAGGFSIEGQFEAGVGVVRTVAVGFLPETHQVQLGCDSSGEERSVCRKVVDLYLQSTDRLFDRSAAECSLVGTVFSGHGAALANAVVSLEDATTLAESDASGTFTIAGVAAGIRTVTVHMIGMFPHEKLVLVSCSKEGDASAARFQLLPRPVTLDQIRVRRTRSERR